MHNFSIFQTNDCFRSIVSAMSFPGEIKELPSLSSQDAEPLSPPLYLLAKTLLDVEVSYFHPFEKDRDFLHLLTFSKPTSASDADFIILPSCFDNSKQLVLESKIGTLLNPDDSALLLIETEDLTKGKRFSLVGPGINERKSCVLPDSPLLSLREDKCKEFPLGIDILFYDSFGRILALPRTTEVTPWDM